MSKKILFFLSSLLFIINIVGAQEIKIWRGSEIKKVAKWKTSMRLYKPRNNSNRGAIIICPGGSYRYLGKEKEGYMVAKKLVKDGFTAFVLKYKVGLDGYHYPSMIQDLQRAIEYVKEHASEYGVDSSNVGLMGFSAGGHLVGTGAEFYNENFMKSLNIAPNVSLKPAYAILMYPVITMTGQYLHKRSKRNLLGRRYEPGLEDKMSLQNHVSRDMPPLLIMQAKDDKTVDYHNSKMMAESLDVAGAQYEYHLMATGGHGFGARPKKNTDMANWYDIFLKWYNNKFKQYNGRF